MFPSYTFTSRLTLCLPQCTKAEKRTKLYFGALNSLPPEIFSAVCSKNGWQATIKVGGVKVTLP